MRIIDWLFSTDMGCPGPGGHWPPWLTVVFHGSNLVIALTDLAIPAVILANWKYRREGVGTRALWTVLLYFPIKAGSRLVRVAELAGNLYHLAAVFDALTAALAVHVALQLGPFLRSIMQTRRKVHDLNDRLQDQVYRIEVMRLEERERNAMLLAEVEAARRALSANVWLGEKHAALDRIAAIVKGEASTSNPR